MAHQNPPEEQIRDLLARARRIAVVGLSPKPDRDSHRIAAYLQARGYEVVPVYPREERIRGQQVYRRVQDIPGGVDLVAVFRRSEHLPAVVEDALASGAKALIVGIGNIYADEILWRSGLQPLSRVENLTKSDIKRIYKGIVFILKKGIELGGSSMDDYRDPEGKLGGFQKFQKAYHKTKSKCARKDGGIIERLKIGGRSAHFCPNHQIKR